MKHDERHAALAAYAFWSKLEQTWVVKADLEAYYKRLFNVAGDTALCPACVIAERRAVAQIAKRRANVQERSSICSYCPCEWSTKDCATAGSLYRIWSSKFLFGYDPKTAAGDITNIMRKWCERVGVIAPRSW